MIDLYYFTCESTDDELWEMTGTLEEALKVAEELAEKRGETIYINNGEDIIDCVFA